MATATTRPLTTKGTARHDKRAADEAGYSLPEGSRLYQDAGFQGFSLAGVTIIQPKKKPRGKELTPEENVYYRSGPGPDRRSYAPAGLLHRAFCVRDRM